MTQVCMISTLFGAITVAAAIDSGVLPDAQAGDRLLLVSNNANAPEIVVPWHETPGAVHLLAHFDRTIYLNDELYPYHPSRWQPPESDLPLLHRALSAHWDLGDGPLELLVDTPLASPASALTSIFRNARISVLSEGLMSYGPSRIPQPLDVAQRVDRLVYFDMLPGVRPLLLQEANAELAPVSTEAFAHVVHTLADLIAREAGPLPDYGDRPTALVLGQYLGSLGILTPEEDTRLSVGMVDAAIAHGAERIVFKPHPSAQPSTVDQLRHEAEDLGAEFEELKSAIPAEVIAANTPLDAVVSCFSTGLVTLNRLYGVPALAVGTELMLERLAPYHNSNRVPITIIDALTRTDAAYRDPEQLHQLLETVAYCMQPDIVPSLRPVAEAFLGELSDEERRRYVKRRRLTKLDLPGALPPPTPAPKPKPKGGRFLAPLRRALRKGRDSLRGR